MSTLTKTSTPYGSPQSKTLAQPIGGLAFDWLMILLSLIFIGGLYLDGWAHNHGKVDQSFFTVWHAFFYAGFALVAFILVATLGIQWQRGYRGASSLPVGYQLSLLGVIIFAMGGVGDLIWHELFGIEQDFDALLSPSHLALGLGLGLVVSGPLRAAWARVGVQPTYAKKLDAWGRILLLKDSNQRAFDKAMRTPYETLGPKGWVIATL